MLETVGAEEIVLQFEDGAVERRFSRIGLQWNEGTADPAVGFGIGRRLQTVGFEPGLGERAAQFGGGFLGDAAERGNIAHLVAFDLVEGVRRLRRAAPRSGRPCARLPLLRRGPVGVVGAQFDCLRLRFGSGSRLRRRRSGRGGWRNRYEGRGGRRRSEWPPAGNGEQRIESVARRRRRRRAPLRFGRRFRFGDAGFASCRARQAGAIGKSRDRCSALLDLRLPQREVAKFSSS